MVIKPIRLGLIGMSPDNGHPYSFSAILNGYDRNAMSVSGWPVIFNYLEKRSPDDFEDSGARVTHIWTQDDTESAKIAAASKISHICSSPEEMIGKVDAVIIARDDYETHYEMARPFLEAGLKLFIDKPLCVDVTHLSFFNHYLKSGLLMSCSGLRYCRELDDARGIFPSSDDLKLARGAVINSFEKYGIHMLDAIFSVVPFNVESVLAIKSQHTSVVLRNHDRSIIKIDALGDASLTFQVDIWGRKHRFAAEIRDNFTAFKRTLFEFVQMVRTECSPIPPDLTIGIMKVLISARISLEEAREVMLDEIRI